MDSLANIVSDTRSGLNGARTGQTPCVPKHFMPFPDGRGGGLSRPPLVTHQSTYFEKTKSVALAPFS